MHIGEFKQGDNIDLKRPKYPKTIEYITYKRNVCKLVLNRAYGFNNTVGHNELTLKDAIIELGKLNAILKELEE